MSKINELLVTESESYISAYLAEHLPAQIIFHDFDHALAIKKYAETIGEHTGLSADEMNLLRISALFHDVGFVHSYEESQEESVKIASAFLAEHNIDPQTIDHISEIIRATKLPQNPKDKIAEALCDADLMYIATESGVEQFDLLYDEVALLKIKRGKRSDYEKGWLDFFTTHVYFTEYGKSVLQPAKEDAARRITRRLNRRILVNNRKENPEKKSINYSRGVDTMFRVTARNQINLNSIADNKSNILISVNAIIISIIITMLAGNIGNMSGDIFPILVFLVICLITIIIAILSTRPNIVTRKFTEEDIKQKNVDLNFFGNFVKLEYDDYHKYLKEIMKEDDDLYSMMIKNQYALGKILSKKFKLVRMAYNVFMVGIIITVIVFILNYLVLRSPA